VKDYILDIVKTIVTTGFYDKIKVTATQKNIAVEAMDKEKEVILKGTFSKPLAELDGEFGLSNLSLLSHIASDSEFNSKDSVIEIIYKTDASGKTPTEIAYTNKSKSYINYRFMSKQLIPDQPKFMEPQWDLVIKPSKSNIQQFAWAASGLGAYEQYFIPKVQDGTLKFFIGEEDAASQRGGVVFATDLTESFEAAHKWKIAQVMTVLKLSETCDCEMAFSTKGVIQITLNTGVGTYRYIFPAKVR
jgi:hypothetical protein